MDKSLASLLLKNGLLGLLGCLLVSLPAAAQVPGGQSVPSFTYYAAQAAMYDGEYADALDAFTRESRGAIKTAQSSWIDSICYRAMLGECYYHIGKYPQAIENYNAALQLYSAYSDWMLRVQFPPTIGPDAARARRQIPWGNSARQFKLGRVPDTMPIAQGQVNNNDVVQRGGVVQKAVLFPIHVQEIVRCTALALRRRAEIMGPICKHDPLTDEVLTKLARRPAPRNHWSQSWIDLQLGLAQVGAGQIAQAQQSLQRSIVVGGQYDHPLTCVALLELGRIALEAGDFNGASRLLAEASYSAVYYEEVGVLDESLRLGYEAHVRSNQQGAFAPLELALRWTRGSRLRHLQVWLNVLAAENQALLGRTPQAAVHLNEAGGLIGRTDLGASVAAARLNHVSALVAYQRNRPDEAREALAAALTFQRGGSRWLYQISLADSLYTRGTVTPRTAMDIYREVLRDPAPADWSSQPLESLTVLAIPHEASYEFWFEVALQRKEVTTALEIADRARRHRFYTTLPMWGRLLSLRTILETPPHELPQNVALQRQDLLVRYPAYDQLSQQADEIEQSLRRDPLVPASEAASRAQAESLASLAKLSAAQEALLHQMALRREPAEMIFPPLRTTDDVQAALPSGTFALVFFQTRRALHGFLLSNERYATWRVQSPAEVQKALAQLLQDMGHYDQNRALAIDDLNHPGWRRSARTLLSALLEGSKIELSQGIEELVIVPDGAMWYVPFEALPLGPGDDAPPLLSRVRVRYVPTLSLAVPDAAPRERGTNMGVVVGKLFPNDKETVAQGAFAQLQRSVPEARALPTPPPAASSLYGALIDRLVVLDDLAVDPEQPYAWSPINLDRGRSASLASWLPLPWGVPDQVVLPGFHTAAEHGLKRRTAAAPGQEMFLTACALMSGGARTILLSRWRTGGETSIDLVRQFVQEVPFTTAAEAWQRSVELVKEHPLNWEREPRLKRFEAAELPRAEHPFFWSGYALIDTGAAPRGDNEPAPADAPPALDFDKLEEQAAED